MIVIVRPEARHELLEAFAWYQSRLQGLGDRFIAAFDAAVDRAVNAPLRYPCVHDEFRQVLLQRFPSSMIYRLDAGSLIVVACFHHSRRPGSWQV